MNNSDTGEQESMPLKECEEATLQSSSESDKAETSQESAEIVEVTPDPDAAVKPTSLRSSVSDAIAMRLVRSYPMQCNRTEEFALNYLMGLHHPVISCFREIRKSDLSLFNTSKWKRHISEPVEQSVVYMGIIDYIATAINNPLYEENFSKSFAKGGFQTVQKIMMDFKNMIGNWSLSDKDVIKKRCKVIMSHLRSLVPLFAASGQDFESVLDCIDSDIIRIKANQERIKTSFPEDAKDISKTISTESTTDDRCALGEIVLNFTSAEDKTKTPFTPALNTTETGKKTSSKVRPPNSQSPKVSKASAKSKMMPSFLQNQKPSTSSNSNKRATADSTSPLNGSPVKKKKKDLTTATVIVVSDNPTTKVSSPTKSSSETGSVSLVSGKKKINAFALLMNKSREIAQAKKLKKLADEAK